MTKYKNNSRFLFMLLVAFLFLGACSDYQKFEPYDLPEEQPGFLNLLRNDALWVEFDATRDHSFITMDTVLIEIPEQAFSDDFGREYTGSVKLVVDFPNKNHHLIGHRLSFVQQDGQLIVPKHVIHIDAYTSSGHRLFLQPGKRIKIKFPRVDQSEMPIIYHAANHFQSGGIVEWIAVKPGLSGSWLTPESWIWKTAHGEIRHEQGMVLYSDLLDWIVIGRPMEDISDVILEVVLPEDHSDMNTQVFVLEVNEMSIQRLLYNGEKELFSTYSRGIPSGTNVVVIALSQSVNEHIFLALHSGMISAETRLYLNLVNHPVDEALHLLENL
jgi:hypothetical protein